MVDYTPTLIPLPATAQGINPATTPLALKAQRDYANALLYGKGQQPVNHWTQGVSNMVSALMGGTMDYNAAQKERGAMGDVGRGLNVDIGGPTGSTSFSDAPSGEGGTKTADAGDLSDMAARKAAIATIESGSPEGNYFAKGPIVQKGAYAGDRAYGKYQVMGKNIPVWTKEVFGQSMTPDEFIRNPQAQEKIFEAKSTSNPRDWFGHGRDDGYTTGANYEKRYAEGLRKYGGGGTQSAQPAMAFSGDSAEAAGPAAIAAVALRGGAASTPRQQAMPVGGGAPLVDPDTVPRQPRISKQDFQAIQSSPYASDAQKAAAFSIYMQQNQPVSVPVTGGSVVVSPYDPRVQRGVSDVHWGEKSLPGGLKYPVPSTVGAGPNGGIIQTPATQAPVGPRSDAGSPVVPSAAPQGGSEPTPASVQAAAQSVPLPTARPSGANAADAAPDSVQVASLDPTAGVAKAGEAPSMPAVTPAEDVAPVIPTGETKVAQVTLSPALGNNSEPPPGYTKDDWESIRRYKEFENDAAIRQKEKEATIQLGTKNEEKQIENGWKDYETNKENARAARDLLPNVETALNLLNDSRTHTGILSGGQDFWSRLKEAFGEKAANAPNELFDKSAAAAVLGALKPALQGTGQVRLMEVQLLQKANASRFYGDAANRAVLEISRRAMTKLATVGKMADQYVLGQDVVDPDGHVLLKAGQGKRHGLDAGFNQIASKWVDGQNAKDLEYYKDTEKLFTTGKTSDGQKLYERGEGDKVPSNPVAGQPWTFHDKQKKDVPAIFDGKNWVPADKYQPQPAVPPVSK